MSHEKGTKTLTEHNKVSLAFTGCNRFDAVSRDEPPTKSGADISGGWNWSGSQEWTKNKKKWWWRSSCCMAEASFVPQQDKQINILSRKQLPVDVKTSSKAYLTVCAEEFFVFFFAIVKPHLKTNRCWTIFMHWHVCQWLINPWLCSLLVSLLSNPVNRIQKKSKC